MSTTYIGKAQIGSDLYKIGTTLYGICNTEAAVASKVVYLQEFDSVMDSLTIFIKFVHGNSATPITLAFTQETGDNPTIRIAATAVEGLCTCGDNEILSFTYEQGDPSKWRAHSCGGVLTQSALDTILEGLGPMRFKGILSTLPANNATTYPQPIGGTISNGDVIGITGLDGAEYIYVASDTQQHWHELGTEGAYVKKTDQSSSNINLLGWTGATVSGGVLSIPSPSTSTVSVVVPASGS